MEKQRVRKKEFLKHIVKLRPCAVCEAESTGYHFGVFSCEACKSFFRRSLKRQRDMVCPRNGNCTLKYGAVKGTPCSACRIKRCLEVGMSLSAVKMGRYSLEKRAETIRESKEYWNSSDSSEGPSTSPLVKTPEGSKDTIPSIKDMKEGSIFTCSSDSIVRSMLVSPSAVGQHFTSPITSNRPHPVLPVPEVREGQGIVNTFDAERGKLAHCSSEIRHDMEAFDTEQQQINSVETSHGGTLEVEVDTYENLKDNVKGSMFQHTKSERELSPNACTCSDDDESVVEFLRNINSSATELDEALGNEDASILDRLTEQTIYAFDKQNFMTRGRLAKLPHYQHKYMMDKRELERVFGPMKPMSISEHQKFMDNTGIDLDCRLERFEKYVRSCQVPYFKKLAIYITSLPGVKTLSLEDQFSLLKYSKAESKLTTQFSAVNVTNKLITLPTGLTMDKSDLLAYHSEEIIDLLVETAGKIQNLGLTDQEYAMMSAVTIIKPEACVTEGGKAKCLLIRERLFQALERLLGKRLMPSDAQRFLKIIQDVVEMINNYSNMYSKEWDKKYLDLIGHIKWPRFITDLIILPDEADGIQNIHSGT